MDLNEKLAQRRKERQLEVAHNQATHEVEQKTTVDVKTQPAPSAPIDDRIKQALNDDLERKQLLKKMALGRVKPWEWFVTIVWVLGSLSTMNRSFLAGAFFLGLFIWFAKNRIQRHEMAVVKEMASIAEAKKLMESIR
jgi:hypothetical protein